MNSRFHRSSRGGFTLIELVVAVAILALLAGAAVPVATMAINSKARRATQQELNGLQLAAAEYFRDTGELPDEVSDMEVNPGVTGWAGPYLQAFSIDTLSGLSQYAVDAWSQPYQLTAVDSVLTILSAGNGGEFGGSNDISITLDVTPIRRELTLEQLKVLNQAVLQYNGTYQATDPLPTDWSGILTKLVSRGYLPSTVPYSTDGWGDEFTADPAGQMPVVRVTSSNL